MTASKRIVGPSPVIVVLQLALLCFIAEGLLVAGAWWGGDGPHSNTFAGMCMILVVLSILLWVFLGPALLGMFLAAIVVHTGNYRRALKAIRNGFDASYVVRGGRCIGMIMVDEKNKALFVNGLIVPFAAVQGVGKGGDSIYIELNKSISAEKRQKRVVQLDTDRMAEVFYYRIRDSLGFSR